MVVLLIGLVAGLIPFVVRMGQSSYKEVNGEIVSYSYFDVAALIGGVVAIGCGTVGWVSLEVSDVQARLVVLLGVVQLARGVGLVQRMQVRGRRGR